ncbi:MAG TPA: hypothetical protein VGI30_06285 [Caulobacteraceae bacterium]
MLKAILERVILFFVPIALGYLWRWATENRARVRGRSEPSAPAAIRLAPPAPAMRPRTVLWLAGAGAILVAASLVGGALWPRGPDRAVYVPAEVQPGGGVTPGHFEPARK